MLLILYKVIEMAIQYVSDKTKDLLEKLSILDKNRPMVDVLELIVVEKAQQLGIHADATPSHEGNKATQSGDNSQLKISHVA